MTLATLQINELSGTSRLFLDYATRINSPIHARLGGFQASSRVWGRVLASPRAVDAPLVDRLVAQNEALGAKTELLARARGLANGSVRTVVTGQQPGIAGGPLLSLYKAATAIELARAIEARWGAACVPIFWLGSDDDDFPEIRELNVVSSSLEVVSVSLDASVFAPGRRVGDIDGRAVARAWDAVAPLVARSDAVEDVAAWMHEGDLGTAAARALVALTGGNLLVLDGRDPLVREAARATLLSFFDQEQTIRTRVQEESETLRAEGYHAQVEMGADSGLFLMSDGVRQRIPPEARQTARATFERDITAATPGVVARTLMQDAALHPVAVVLGPAEIAYRAQLSPVFDLLRVDSPVVFPRLTATYTPPEVKTAGEECGVSPHLLASAPAEWVERATRALMRPKVAEAAADVEKRFRSDAEKFVKLAAERLEARAKEKLERRFADLIQRVSAASEGAIEQDALAGAARWPWLATASQMFARDGHAQERFLSALVPYTFEGARAWPMVELESAVHVASTLDGAVMHRVYSR